MMAHVLQLVSPSPFCVEMYLGLNVVRVINYNHHESAVTNGFASEGFAPLSLFSLKRRESRL